jgi:hypothetical protein
MRQRIRNKNEASALFAAGVFGNYVQQWESLQEVVDSGYTGLLVFRSRGAGGGKVVYDLTVEAAAEVPFTPGLNYFNEQLNDQHKHVTFQGEIFRHTRGLELRFSLLNLPMREAMENHSRHAHGLRALMMMQHFCCAPGYEKIMELLDEYDGHVAEFTVFDIPCGALQWRTIVWEVRNY